MKAITVEPMKPRSARLEEVPDPDPRDGAVLVEAIAVGVCGTDVEMVGGQVRLGSAGQGAARARARVGSGAGSSNPGPARRACEGQNVVVGIIRPIPRPIPCPNCAVGQMDMCRNGQYTERGIERIDGYMSERWRIECRTGGKKVDRSLGLLGVLLEPTTIVMKALEQVRRRNRRSLVLGAAESALVTGAGANRAPRRDAPAGDARAQEVHVLDRVEWGPKPELVRALGATYHTGAASPRSGSSPTPSSSAPESASSSRTRNPGARSRRHRLPHRRGERRPHRRADRGQSRRLSGAQEQLVVGSVNANRRHWYRAGEALARAQSRVARGPALAPRAAGVLHEGPRAQAGRREGRGPVLGSVSGGIGARLRVVARSAALCHDPTA